jgi:ribosomal protein S18 acetylase RimI-like enzyme
VMVGMRYREMTLEDYDEVYQLWSYTDGVGLSEADSKDNISVFLKRNKGLSFVCEDGNKIVGTILCGHDGRRGYVYHVVVDKNYRREGIGRELVARSLTELNKEGITKCHLFVFLTNELGRMFWASLGWERREDIIVYSKATI